MAKKVKKVHFELVTSLGASLKEVLVTYDLNESTYHYPIFIEPKEGYTNKNYLKEAKEIFANDLKSGEVFRSAKLVSSKRKISSKSHGALIATTCVLAIAAVALAGLFTYKYFSSVPQYEPGQEVEVQPKVSDPTGGDYRVTFSNTKAKVAEKFETKIDLISKNADVDSYYLPEKLVSVISNKTVLKEEQYIYTLDAKSKSFATLEVPAENVLGPIIFNLSLEKGEYEPGQTVEVIPEVSDPTKGCYKVKFDKLEAKVGANYSTTIELAQVKPSDDTYVLPDKLVSILSGSTILNPDRNQFTYTTIAAKTYATLEIPGKYVYGKVIVNLALSPVEPGPTPVVGDPRLPLTFVSNSNGGEIDIHYEVSETKTPDTREINLEYQIDDGVWTHVEGLKQSETSYDLAIKTDIKKGQVIRFCGDNDYWSITDKNEPSPFPTECMTFTTKGSFVVGNNVMSLLDKETFRDDKDLSDETGCFMHLFGSLNNVNTAITDASGLCLPAETLAPFVYYGMFQNCKNLLHSPIELPATTLVDSCYSGMFDNCESLTRGPIQISSSDGELAKMCCESMFEGCTSLIEAPSLPSTNLAAQCYENMFGECSSLEIAPYLPASANQLRKNNDWISSCYYEMFSGCSKLKYLSVGFELYENSWPGYADRYNEMEYLCTARWLHDAGKKATDKKFVWSGPKENLPFELGENTIPDGWTIVNPTL